MEALSLLLPLVAFVAAVGLVLAIYGIFTADRQVLQERLAGYSHAGTQASVATSSGTSILKQRRFSDIPLVQSLLSERSFADGMAADLAAAGVPLRVGEYLMIRWLSALVLGAAVIFAGLSWLIALPVGVVGFFLPKFYIRRRQQRRVMQFNDQLVDALTMMSNALKSGSSFLQAIDLVAHELPAPIGEEFSQVIAETNVGAPLDEALQNLSRRINSYDLYLVVTAMLVQRQTGGNLAEVLENIAHTIRERMRLLRQVQVLTSEERFSAIVVGLLPLFVLVVLALVSPSYHRPALEQPLGRMILAVGFGLQLVGFLVMRRLTQIDV